MPGTPVSPAQAFAVALGPSGEVYAGGVQRLAEIDYDQPNERVDHGGWVARFDNGTETWHRQQNGDAAGGDRILALRLWSDGVLFAAGSLHMHPLAFQADSDRDAWLVAYEPDGTAVWRSRYDGAAPPDRRDPRAGARRSRVCNPTSPGKARSPSRATTDG